MPAVPQQIGWAEVFVVKDLVTIQNKAFCKEDKKALAKLVEAFTRNCVAAINLSKRSGAIHADCALCREKFFWL